MKPGRSRKAAVAVAAAVSVVRLAVNASPAGRNCTVSRAADFTSRA